MEAENFLQALKQAMSPKAHDAIDNAISSNNRMKFQGGGKVDWRAAREGKEIFEEEVELTPWSLEDILSRSTEFQDEESIANIEDIIKLVSQGYGEKELMDIGVLSSQPGEEGTFTVAEAPIQTLVRMAQQGRADDYVGRGGRRFHNPRAKDMSEADKIMSYILGAGTGELYDEDDDSLNLNVRDRLPY